MKLLIDENLSRRLVPRIRDLYPLSVHVSEAGLLRQPDTMIWDFALRNGFAVVTADADFYEMSITLGHPPKVIWLRGCDYPTAVAEVLLRGQAIRIVEFLNDPERAILILRR